MQIGPYKLENPVVCAPMAGVTDQPYRQMCYRWGAGLTVSEMLSSNPRVWKSVKSQKRMDHSGELGIRSVQIAGADPELLAEAALFNVSMGAQIVDINMGCPAKKVNKKLAGSALMREPALVASICQAVVEAVDIPVTLKIRTGWDLESRNACEIASIAEQSGIQAITVHGRTRACAYRGEAEYETIRNVKQAVAIPVIANGDIDSPQKAKQVLKDTGADAIMIGRGALGRPWLFGQVAEYLATGRYQDAPKFAEQGEILTQHIEAIHRHYGIEMGVRIARKHVGWFTEPYDRDKVFRSSFNQTNDADAQLALLQHFYTNTLIDSADN